MTMIKALNKWEKEAKHFYKMMNANKDVSLEETIKWRARWCVANDMLMDFGVFIDYSEV